MTYEELLTAAEENDLIVQERTMNGHDGLIKGRHVAIRKNIETSKEKACVLAEELGHHCTSSGNIIDMQDVMNRKQEHRARVWAYNKQIGLLGLIRAFEHGCRNLWEVADYLDVPDDFLEEALTCYKQKYGTFTVVDQYVIYFIPALKVGKVFR